MSWFDQFTYRLENKLRRSFTSTWNPEKKRKKTAIQLPTKKMVLGTFLWFPGRSFLFEERSHLFEVDSICSRREVRSWWTREFLLSVGGFNQPIWKVILVKMGENLPQVVVKIPKIFELPAPSFWVGGFVYSTHGHEKYSHRGVKLDSISPIWFGVEMIRIFETTTQSTGWIYEVLLPNWKVRKRWQRMAYKSYILYIPVW